MSRGLEEELFGLGICLMCSFLLIYMLYKGRIDGQCEFFYLTMAICYATSVLLKGILVYFIPLFYILTGMLLLGPGFSISIAINIISMLVFITAHLFMRRRIYDMSKSHRMFWFYINPVIWTFISVGVVELIAHIVISSNSGVWFDSGMIRVALVDVCIISLHMLILAKVLYSHLTTKHSRK